MKEGEGEAVGEGGLAARKQKPTAEVEEPAGSFSMDVHSLV